MSEILSIFGLIALFVGFGFFYRNGRAGNGCSSCNHKATVPECASCDLVHDTTESFHGRP